MASSAWVTLLANPSMVRVCGAHRRPSPNRKAAPDQSPSTVMSTALARWCPGMSRTQVRLSSTWCASTWSPKSSIISNVISMYGVLTTLCRVSLESPSNKGRLHNNPVMTWLVPFASSSYVPGWSGPWTDRLSPGSWPSTLAPHARNAVAQPWKERAANVPSRSNARGWWCNAARVPKVRAPSPDSPGVRVAVRGAGLVTPWMATASSPNSKVAPSWALIIMAWVQSSDSEGRRNMVVPSANVARAKARCMMLLLGGAHTLSPDNVLGRTFKIMLSAGCARCTPWRCLQSMDGPSGPRTPPCAFLPGNPALRETRRRSPGGRCRPRGLCSPTAPRWA